jgi:hypothetical protein
MNFVFGDAERSEGASRLGDAEDAALEGAVGDFAALAEKHRPCQVVVGLALVQAAAAALARFSA